MYRWGDMTLEVVQSLWQTSDTSNVTSCVKKTSLRSSFLFYSRAQLCLSGPCVRERETAWRLPAWGCRSAYAEWPPGLHHINALHSQAPNILCVWSLNVSRISSVSASAEAFLISGTQMQNHTERRGLSMVCYDIESHGF